MKVPEVRWGSVTRGARDCMAVCTAVVMVYNSTVCSTAMDPVAAPMAEVGGVATDGGVDVGSPEAGTDEGVEDDVPEVDAIVQRGLERITLSSRRPMPHVLGAY